MNKSPKKREATAGDEMKQTEKVQQLRSDSRCEAYDKPCTSPLMEGWAGGGGGGGGVAHSAFCKPACIL